MYGKSYDMLVKLGFIKPQQRQQQQQANGSNSPKRISIDLNKPNH